jgi:hypothetical protein
VKLTPKNKVTYRFFVVLESIYYQTSTPPTRSLPTSSSTPTPRVEKRVAPTKESDSESDSKESRKKQKVEFADEEEHLTSESANELIPFRDIVEEIDVAFENAEFRDMINVDKTTMNRDIRRAYTGFLTLLSWRYLSPFKDASGRWLKGRENERRRRDTHTALVLQICRALTKTGVKGVLKHEVKIGVRVALEKKCYNERVRLQHMQQQILAHGGGDGEEEGEEEPNV